MVRHSGDKVFIGVFVVFLIIAWFCDLISVLAPHGGWDTDPATGALRVTYGLRRDTMHTYAFPPQLMWGALIWWGELCDELLLVNPLWFRAMAFLSPFVYGPFYVYAIRGFMRGDNSIRVPCIVYSVLMAHNLIILFLEAAYGKLPSKNFPVFASAYGPYLLFPLALLYRMRDAEPFGPTKQRYD